MGAQLRWRQAALAGDITQLPSPPATSWSWPQWAAAAKQNTIRLDHARPIKLEINIANTSFTALLPCCQATIFSWQEFCLSWDWVFVLQPKLVVRLPSKICTIARLHNCWVWIWKKILLFQRWVCSKPFYYGRLELRHRKIICVGNISHDFNAFDLFANH